MCCYEQFKNEFVLHLNQSGFNEVDIKRITELLNLAAYNYDVTRKETQVAIYNQELPEVAKMYIVSKKVEGFSKQTIYNYKKYLEIFFFALQKAPEQVTTNDIRVFLYRYQEERKISNRSLEKYRSTISSFYEWACLEGYLEKNPAKPIKKIKYEKKQRVPLTQIELEYLRKACKTPKELAIIEVMYSTGCRVSELTSLKKTDIDWQEKTVHLFGKGSKHRTSFLNAKAEVALKEYFRSREDNNEWVFVSDRRPHNQMHKCGIEKILKILSGRVADTVHKPITPHILRHTTATQAMAANMPLEDIQTLLGHEQISTTLIYAQNNVEHVKAEHKRCII